MKIDPNATLVPIKVKHQIKAFVNLFSSTIRETEFDRHELGTLIVGRNAARRLV